MSTIVKRDLSTVEKVVEFLEESLSPLGYESFTDYCFAYGEPGYSDPEGETAMIVFGSYWCRCADSGEEPYSDGRPRLHDKLGTHYPDELAALEQQGVVFEWHDEWIIEHETSKAYRTEADSAFWMPSYVLWECDLLTPDNDMETWLDWITEDTWDDAVKGIPERALPARFDTVVGWERFPDDATDFRNDWYGNADDPKEIRDLIRAEHGEETQVVFILTESHMFGIRFEAYYKVEGEDD